MDDRRTALEDALKIVRAMRQIHSGRGTWTQHMAARDRHSRSVDPSDPRAVRFCLVGASWRAISNVVVPARGQVLVWETFNRRIDRLFAHHWNDEHGRTFKDIVACEEGVIRDLEAQLAAASS